MSAAPDTATEDIRASQITPGRMVHVDGRWETVTTVSTARAGFVEFRTDRRDDTNLPFTYRPDDRLTALVASQVWDDSVPPGGYVCSACGTPVESEPCPQHGAGAPTA